MATIYKAPVQDYVFLLHDVFGPRFPELIGELTADDTSTLLGEAAKLLEEVWAPLDEVGDAQGCTFADGAVTTPSGFKNAFDLYRNSGWNSISASVEDGGGGLPNAMAQALREFTSSANNSLGLYFGLTNGAHATIRRNGEDWMRRHVVPRMTVGEWTGTMCLTEPHCGTDLRLMKTKAVPQQDGSYRISGTKIFISAGDHDMAGNIVHLVLAKVPDADGRVTDALGSVNLFLVPKWNVDPATGELGARNGVTTGGIEHKMGLKGNATCTMNFEEAIGYRIGGSKEGAGKSSSAGMSGMFELMNHARINTGIQSLGSAVRAHGHAVQYAKERLAGRALDPAQRSAGAADPIICHADVRRLLLKQAAYIEGARALALYVRATQDAVGESQAHDKAIGVFLTPVVKAYLTDKSFEATNDALQVMGGHGYIRENGLEQLVRDARIFQLYEGANGVQAFDLAARKLKSADGWAAFCSYASEVEQCAEQALGDPSLKAMAAALMEATAAVRTSAQWITDAGRKLNDAPGASYDFLRMMGIHAFGYMWLVMAMTAVQAVADGSGTDFHRRKLALARYWMEKELPMLSAFGKSIASGSECLMDLPADLV
ncbi:MAG: acyl-CoA dehydrogenase C-terminal domain-containing protein [Thauera sp.]|nr:acyl-CoA dehydrogenase C-terminal domain-containing protein [Thauera sp.]